MSSKLNKKKSEKVRKPSIEARGQPVGSVASMCLLSNLHAPCKSVVSVFLSLVGSFKTKKKTHTHRLTIADRAKKQHLGRVSTQERQCFKAAKRKKKRKKE